MNHPQTAALEISRKLTKQRLETINKYGCCAFVLLWCLGIEPKEDLTAIETVSDMMDAKVLDEECTVSWTAAIKHLTGRTVSVEFKDIKDLRGIRERTPVRFDYKGKSHWVGVERGMICFNPLEYSQCVDKGRPVTARIIKLAK